MDTTEKLLLDDIDKDMKKSEENLAKAVEEIESLISNKKLSKAASKELINLINKSQPGLAYKYDWMKSEVEKMLASAKTNLSEYLNGILRDNGIKQLSTEEK